MHRPWECEWSGGGGRWGGGGGCSGGLLITWILSTGRPGRAAAQCAGPAAGADPQARRVPRPQVWMCEEQGTRVEPGRRLESAHGCGREDALLEPRLS
eukprot:366008-Chlamydomonas_euryale.AAC.13